MHIDAVYAFFCVIGLLLLDKAVLYPAMQRSSGWRKSFFFKLSKLSDYLFPLLFALVVEKKGVLSLGLGYGHVPFLNELAATILLFAGLMTVQYIFALVWRHGQELYIDSENRLNCIGNTMPAHMVTPRIFYQDFHIQLLYIAIPEELLYRGYLLSRLCASLGMVSATVVASALFALAHIDRLKMLLPTFLSGILFSIAFLYTGSIWPCVIAHIISNHSTSLVWKYLAIDMRKPGDRGEALPR